MAVNNNIKSDRIRRSNRSSNLVDLFPVQNKQKVAPPSGDRWVMPTVTKKQPDSQQAPSKPKEALNLKKSSARPQIEPEEQRERLQKSVKGKRKKADLRPVPTNVKTKKRIRKPSPSLPLPVRFCLYALRLIIVGVGIGTIAGTVLASIDPASLPIPVETPQQETTTAPTEIETPALKQPSGLILNKRLTSLEYKIAAIATKYPKMQPRVFFVDLDNGAYADLEADTPTSAASTIKIPILIAFLEDVDAGKIRLDEMLTMSKETIGGGSGSMQYKKVGSKFTALETATKTIVISDNTATNMLIQRMGGAEVLNQRFLDWGMRGTSINNPLPDLKGTNLTSTRDLAYILALVERGDLLSLRSRDRLLQIMRRTRTKTLLPKGLGKGAIIAHKTGDIGSILADAGVIDMPDGKRYLAAVMVKRPHNDYSARTMIQQISRAAYKHFEFYRSPS